jgi:hypothetical protein
MAMSSGMYSYAIAQALTGGADAVNLTTFGSIGAAIVATISAGDCSAKFVSLTAADVQYAGASTGWTELATAHGYTQGTPTSGFATPTAFSAATNKLQWPAASKNFVWTASDATGIVQAVNTGIVVYWAGATKDLLVFDYITGANSATGSGATYTATWASGVFTIQIV